MHAHYWERYGVLHVTAGLERREGVKVDWVQGMWFNPLTSQWAWSYSTSVNYALRAARTL